MINPRLPLAALLVALLSWPCAAELSSDAGTIADPAVGAAALTFTRAAQKFEPKGVQLAAAGNDAPTAGLGTYSEGYRMGMLGKFSIKGFALKSGEGELLLGADSSVVVKVTGSGDSQTRKQINPWAFSSDKSQASQINPFLGEYVYIQYKQAQIAGISRDTDYNLVDINRVDKSKARKGACEAGTKKGSFSGGARVGRIVKASFKGTVSKTYEIMIQVNGTGNEFIEMSALDESMYECAVDWLKAGSKAKITYQQSYLFNPLARDTDYQITKIEPLASLD